MIFAYVFGTIAALILGAGMCFTMGAIGASLSYGFTLGIIIGCIGIILCIANYFIYLAILKSRKNKYGAKIIEISNGLLNK